jgi:hypothetical protein
VDHGTGIGKMTDNSAETQGNRDPGYRGRKAHPSERPVVWSPYSQKVKRGYKERSEGTREGPKKLRRVVMKGAPGSDCVEQPTHHQEPTKDAIQNRH